MDIAGILKWIFYDSSVLFVEVCDSNSYLLLALLNSYSFFTWTQVYLTTKSPLFSILIILRHCVIAQSQIQVLFSLWISMIICSWWLIQSWQVIFHYSYVITCSRSSNCNKVNSYKLYVVLRESCSWLRGFIWCLHEMCAVDLAFYK